MRPYTLFLFCWLGLSTVAAHPAWGIVVDADRNIYFADLLHNGRGSVWKWSARDELTLLLADFHAHNVSLDAAGRLVTAHGEMDEHTLVRLDREGRLDTLFHATDFRAFNGGNCTYTPSGEIVFGAENYLWRLTADGRRQRLSDRVFAWNKTVFADQRGNYYGPDIGSGTGQLVRIDPLGRATVLADSLITRLDRPYDRHADVLLGIGEDRHGALYIAELAGQRIVRIADDGPPTTFYRTPGDWFPTGIYFRDDAAYILEFRERGGHAGPRIVQLDTAGRRTVLFDYDTYPRDQIRQGAPQEDRNNPWSVGWLIGIGVGLLLAGWLGWVGWTNAQRRLG